MQLGGVSQEAIRGNLRGLGYDDALIQTDWTPHDVVGDREPISVPVMAFWGKPHDQFRSAIAVVQDGGIPPRQVAERSISHVLQCKDETATLWLLRETDLERKAQAPIGHLEGLLDAHRGQVDRVQVAQTKIRLRQYALYEADPQGHAFWQWAIRPTIDQARFELEQLVAKTKSRWDSDLSTADWARWLFRVVALRVGLDSNWSVASGLDRRDGAGFVDRAAQYPTHWRSAIPSHQRSAITEYALEALSHFDFRTVDHLFVSKAVGAAALQSLRLDIDLFPTPKPFAWDMMASIPLTEDIGVCDATAGTGTFLIAAGHAVWRNSRSTKLPDLQNVLRGADSSPFSTDLARIGLDLAFGYNDTGWSIDNKDAKQAVAALPTGREWALVGNPPWAGKGTGQNAASDILSHYVDALSKRRRGWIALVLPRVVLTHRLRKAREMRRRIAAEFQLESAWNLPYGSIPGGRSQGIAISLSLGRGTNTSVWKQLGVHGEVHTVGYRQASDVNGFFTSAHAHFMQSKFASYPRLGDWFESREGVVLKSESRRQPIPDGGHVPFLQRLAQLKALASYPCSGAKQRDDLALLRLEDAISNDGWLKNNCISPAHAYRNALGRLPHIVVPRTVWEGVENLCCSILVAYGPLVVSDAFCALIPKGDMSNEFAQGVAAILRSLLARLWIHLHAHAGRHVSIDKLRELPLPPKEVVEFLGEAEGAIALGHVIAPDSNPCHLFNTERSFEKELRICSIYGLDVHESAALLALGEFLGFRPSGQKSLRDVMKGVRTDRDRLKQLRRRVEMAEVDSERSRLYLEALAEEQKDEYLVVETDHCQLSIEKLSFGKEYG